MQAESMMDVGVWMPWTIPTCAANIQSKLKAPRQDAWHVAGMHMELSIGLLHQHDIVDGNQASTGEPA